MVNQRAYDYHVVEAERAHKQLLEVLVKITAEFHGALSRTGNHPGVASVSLSKDTYFGDLIGDRNKFIALTTMHATMATMYK